ncbi:MAG: S-layer homology domain-containing protein [Clostridia bacterium]|nr:S-layer homology domain-containing protein [Clostridia bacterium]
MKKKLKGLISIYLAVIMALSMALSAFAANPAMLYTGDEAIEVNDNKDHSEFDEININFSKKLNKQIDVTVPDNHEHTGWKIWEANESGGLNFYNEPDEVDVDFTVTEDYYNEIVDFGYLFVIEPVFTEKHDHSYIYEADGAAITESYDCGCTGHTETAEIKAPDDLVYNGKAKKATVSYSDNWQGGTLEITYDPSDIINCGSIEASIEKDGEVASVTYEIAEKPVDEEIDLAKPRANRTPVTALETDEYNATVSWEPLVDEKFAYETVYTATIEITAKTNYTTEGVEFTVPGADDVSQAGDTVTAIFPKTGKKHTGSTGGDTGPRTYNIQFESNGGSYVKIQSVEEGKKVIEPEDPTKEGAEFAGWHIDSELTEEYDFDEKVTKGFTLYAGWTEDEEDVTGKDEKDKTDGNDKESAGSTGGGNDDCARNIECPITPFKDGNAKAWYHDGVHYCLEKGYMIGYSSDMLHPNDTLTRAMIITMLWRIEEEPSSEYEFKFTDVTEDNYYYTPLKWAVENGIVADGEEFAPADEITREEFALMLYNYAKYKGMDMEAGENTNILSYEDFDKVSEEAIPAMQFVASTKIVIGKTSTTLNPKDTLTRAEFAEMIYRFLG